MGRTKRKYQAELARFNKALKTPLKNVLAIMPEDFSIEFFLSEFKLLYAYLWNDICDKAKEYHRMDKVRVHKGLPRMYFLPKPINYLETVSKPIIQNKELHKRLVMTKEERVKLRQTLIVQNDVIIKKRKDTLAKNLRYIQETTPSYTNYYIQAYFSVKHQKPIDIDTRYAVLQEASRYKCPATIKFLYKVNASERNFHLRYFAFRTLQQFGEKEVRLRRNRKGKKRPGDRIEPHPLSTPDDLLHFIYNSQLEQVKTYDLFISHSSSDSNLILNLKAYLNNMGLNVYVDWISDRNALKRELTNANTAKAIIERLNSSKALLYIHTESSCQSQWTPWELGYFHALRENKICVYSPNEILKPAYIEIYPSVLLMDNKFIVETENNQISLMEWLTQ